MELQPWVETAARVSAIVVLALVVYLLIRSGVGIGVRHLLERRDASEPGVLPPEELERRVVTLQRLAVRIVGSVVAIIALLMVLDQFGIDIGPAVAGLGVVGIAVGLGAQSLVHDWLAGVFVVLENQYSVGDIVRVGGVSGTVEEFNLRRTTLRDLDGTLHSVPNGQISVASNLSRVWARVNLDVGVAYDTDLDRATAVIDEIGAGLAAEDDWSSRVLEPPAVRRVEELGDSSVTLKVLGRVQAGEQWAVAGELRRRILAGFARNGIEIPFPHRVMISRPGSPGSASDVGSEGGAGD